jgi:GNAT superfamily N-acetyltransferase
MIVAKAKITGTVPPQLVTFPDSTAADVPAVPLLDRYAVKWGHASATAYDGERVIASYRYGLYIFVDPDYRRKGIARELIYQRAKRSGRLTSKLRTPQIAAIIAQVSDRIACEAKLANKA